MGRTLATTVITHHRRRLKGRAQRITIDLDPTDDPTRATGLGLLQWALGHLVLFAPGGDADVQRRSRAVAGRHRLAAGPQPRQARGRGIAADAPAPPPRRLPQAALRVRVDGGVAGNDWLEVLETERVEYGVGLAGNARLTPRAGRLRGEA